MPRRRPLGHFEQFIKRPKPWLRSTYVLLAETVRIVKIGATERIDERINDIQLMSPVELLLIATHGRDIEKWMHTELMSRRLHGEWFAYDDKVAALIAAEMTPCRVSCLAGKELGWQKVARTFGWQQRDPTT